jgi:hypothetical protein
LSCRDEAESLGVGPDREVDPLVALVAEESEIYGGPDQADEPAGGGRLVADSCRKTVGLGKVDCLPRGENGWCATVTAVTGIKKGENLVTFSKSSNLALFT